MTFKGLLWFWARGHVSQSRLEGLPFHNGTHTLQASYLQESICCFYALIKSPLLHSHACAHWLTFSSVCWVLSAIKPIHLVRRWEISVCAPGTFGSQLMTFPAATTKTVRKVALLGSLWSWLQPEKDTPSLVNLLRQFHLHHQHFKQRATHVSNLKMGTRDASLMSSSPRQTEASSQKECCTHQLVPSRSRILKGMN